MKFHRFMSQEEVQEQVSKAMVPHIIRFVIKIMCLAVLTLILINY